MIFISGCQLTPDKENFVVHADVRNSSGNVEKVDSWWLSGRAELKDRLDLQPIMLRAKNVILFVGDGMSISTVTAARIFDGQSKGGLGEENVLPFERFPNLALVKTYNTNAQVPDSAGTASAMNTGIKTRIGVINMRADQVETECFRPSMGFQKTLAEIAEEKGMSTGIVTTTRVTHATPAAVYGHSPSRRWENDTLMPNWAKQRGCLDIAEQLTRFPFGDGLDVILGGGSRHFLPKVQGGKRGDGKHLINEWRSKSEGVNFQREYVENVQDFRALESSKTNQVMGLFSSSHMDYEVDRIEAKQPSLSEMAEFAVKRLATNKKGYFLMIEGGRIDHAHHATNAYRALTDTQAFAQAIGSVLKQVDLSETLILVTADHSHVFTIAGYPQRGNPILGLVKHTDHSEQKTPKKPLLAKDGKPYTTLGYHNGKNVRRTTSELLTENEVRSKDFRQQAAVPLKRETHSGEDVALYAIGPWSHLVGGVIEQHTIFHIMAHALGWRFKEALEH